MRCSIYSGVWRCSCEQSLGEKSLLGLLTSVVFLLKFIHFVHDLLKIRIGEQRTRETALVLRFPSLSQVADVVTQIILV